ncbi:F-type H+-transporting ATPase subunit delta [Paenibacillus castaneae]|uniref:F0F1 ATP synthase subunit delta n=1 Tax=Paenibacillus castaneae TaxID=474957 RepID=UPI000C9BCE75|nr:F0F1 ATP synthase subunit delta [Paenibacillus castaneae]NIK79411.1 F-type H+-transporting ATPase subunit delta [Paenibacillus castaneae]
MSRDTVVAKRYAKALFELAEKQQAVAEVEGQLKLIVGVLEQDPEIEKFLSLPSIDPASKIAVLKAAFGDQVSALVLNTLEILITRRRQGDIADVYAAYTKVAGDSLGQAHATVYAAKALSDEELAGVAAQFGQVTGKTIIAQQIVEPSLLGGVQVRIGDRLYDGSLSGKLDRLQKSFKI